MIIELLRIENVKGVKVVELAPPKEGVQLIGKNGAGKSSILDSIIWALHGGRDIPADVIREGQRKAEIEIHLNGDPKQPKLKITKTFSRGNTKGRLKIEGDDKQLSPQALLDTIVGNISFNPTKFMDADKKKQRDMLLDGLGLTAKLAEIDQQVKAKVQERQAKHREVETAKGKASAYKKVPVPAKVDIAKEQARLSDLKEAHAGWIQMTNALRDAEAQKERLVNRVLELEGELKKAKDDLGTCEGNIATMMDNLTGEPDDGSQLEQELREAYATNQQHDQAQEQNKKAKEAAKELSDRQAEWDAIDGKVKALESSKQDLLNDVEWPVENLEFDEDGLILNGREFQVASLGERITAACKIGMALNPTLKVMLIDGNALDQENLELVKQLAKDQDFQLWIEMVRSDGSPAIEIEDGTVKDSIDDGESD